jgi:hypothetical protein
MRYPLFHEVSRTRVRELQRFAVKMEAAGATRGKVPYGPYGIRLPPRGYAYFVADEVGFASFPGRLATASASPRKAAAV